MATLSRKLAYCVWAALYVNLFCSTCVFVANFPIPNARSTNTSSRTICGGEGFLFIFLLILVRVS